MRISLAVLSVLAAAAVPSVAFAADYPDDDYSYRDRGSYERSYDRRADYDDREVEERVVMRRPAPARRVYVEEPAPVVYVAPRYYGPRFYGPRPIVYGPRFYGPRGRWAHRRW